MTAQLLEPSASTTFLYILSQDLQMGQNQTKTVANEEESAAKVLEDDEPDDW